MAPVKIKFVVSFSSQDKVHKASNLLVEGSKRWLSDPQDRSGQIEAIFQLEQPCSLAFIDIGVIWCASIEVRVGKSDWPQGQSYVSLVPTQVLMSPVDSRLSRNVHRTCMFSMAQFSKEGATNSSSWDRIQVVGRQPWRKDVQLGLSFLRVRGIDGSAVSVTNRTSASPHTSMEDKDSGHRLSVEAIKERFFGNSADKTDENNELKKRLQKIAATAEGGTDNPSALSRTARMVLLANKSSSKPGQQSHQKQQTPSSSTEHQQEISVFTEEAHHFLGTLNIERQDIDSLKVSDLRHKFEKQKWRKLTADEKRIFYNCCQNFIGSMFDEDENTPTTTTGVASVRAPVSTKSPSHLRKLSKSTSKERPVVYSRGDTKSEERIPTKESSCGESSPKPSTSRNSRHNRTTGDGHTSRLSGGFLTSGFQATRPATAGPSCSASSESPLQTNACVVRKKRVQEEQTKTVFAPNEFSAGRKPDPSVTPQTSDTPDKPGLLSNRTSPMPNRDDCTPHKVGLTPSKAILTQSKSNVTHTSDSAAHKRPVTPHRSAVNGSVVMGKDGEHSNSLGARSSYSKKTASATPPLTSVSASKASAVSRTSGGSKYSNIDPSLLKSHKQFVRARMKNICPTVSSDPSSPSEAGRRSFSEELDNIETYHSSPEELPYTNRIKGSSLSSRTSRGRGSSVSTKRAGSPLRGSENLAPAKRSLQLSGGDGLDATESAGQWLNAKRRQERERDGPAVSSSKHNNKSDSPLASRGRERSSRGRGRGRGTVNRRLEMPAESTITNSPSSSSPSSPGSNNSNNPYAGELTIDEDTDFVECPLCQGMFPADTVGLHASDCTGTSPEGVVSDGVSFVQCPLCEEMFDEAVVAEHASACGL